MKLYLSVIGAAMATVAALNIAFGAASWYYVIISVIWCTALQFILDGIVAVVIKLTPDRLYGIDNPLFQVSEWEMELYRRLRVRLWKDKVWELGGAGGFSKKSILRPDDPEYVEKFIVESNKGVLTHRLSYPIGLLAMLTLEGVCVFTVALPIAFVNLFLNVLPTVVLRYNTPKLRSLLRLIERKAKK